jgi:hypothetical protein
MRVEDESDFPLHVHFVSFVAHIYHPTYSAKWDISYILYLTGTPYSHRCTDVTCI